MRVLTYTSLFPNCSSPSQGIFIYQRMAHFARRTGNSVEVVAPVPYVPAWLAQFRDHPLARVPEREQIGELTVHHPRYLLVPKVMMPLHGLSMFFSSVRLVRRLHRERQFDLIDAHYVYPDGFAGALLGKRLGLPVVVSARGTDINLFPSFRLIRPMLKWTLRHAAGAIAVCRKLQDIMLTLGLKPEHARVIGNGVDVDRFAPVERAEARSALALSPEDQIVVAVGALIPRKGYHLLIPALAEIAPRYSRLKLYVVGEGPERSRLQRMTDELGLAGRVFLAGAFPNERLRYWYSAADVSCLTSSREGWPNVVLESMACGTPVVATGLWGVPEIITSPELGVMVEQEAHSIAQGLASALDRRWDREALIRYARGRTWEVVAAEVEEFLRAHCAPASVAVHA